MCATKEDDALVDQLHRAIAQRLIKAHGAQLVWRSSLDADHDIFVCGVSTRQVQNAAYAWANPLSADPNHAVFESANIVLGLPTDGPNGTEFIGWLRQIEVPSTKHAGGVLRASHEDFRPRFRFIPCSTQWRLETDILQETTAKIGGKTIDAFPENFWRTLDANAMFFSPERDMFKY